MQGLIQPLYSRLLWLGIAMLAALAFGVDILARLFWFEALGYDTVFWRILLLKAALFVVAGLVTYSYVLLNFVALSRRIDQTPAPHGSAGTPWTPVDPTALSALRPHTRWLIPTVTLAPAVVIGLIAAGSWDTVLRFLWRQPFGRVDPVFGHDLGFYLFSLPLLELVQNLEQIPDPLGASVAGRRCAVVWRRETPWRELTRLSCGIGCCGPARGVG
jgi:uncharacterized protein